MKKIPNSQSMNNTNRDETATVVAGIMGMSSRAVRMVIQGETSNELVLEAVMLYKEGKAELIASIKSKIVQEAEKLVPFEKRASISKSKFPSL